MPYVWSTARNSWRVSFALDTLSRWRVISFSLSAHEIFCIPNLEADELTFFNSTWRFSSSVLQLASGPLGSLTAAKFGKIAPSCPSSLEARRASLSSIVRSDSTSSRIRDSSCCDSFKEWRPRQRVVILCAKPRTAIKLAVMLRGSILLLSRSKMNLQDFNITEECMNLVFLQ